MIPDRTVSSSRRPTDRTPENPVRREASSGRYTFGDSEVNEWAKTAMDPLVIHVQLGSKVVSRVLVDSGSSSDILYWDAFQKLGFEQNNLRPTTCTLVGFGGERVKALGVITL